MSRRRCPCAPDGASLLRSLELPQALLGAGLHIGGGDALLDRAEHGNRFGALLLPHEYVGQEELRLAGPRRRGVILDHAPEVVFGGIVVSQAEVEAAVPPTLLRETVGQRFEAKLGLGGALVLRVELEKFLVARYRADGLGLVEGRRAGLQIVAARELEERVGMEGRSGEIADQPVVLSGRQRVVLRPEIGFTQVEESVVRLIGAGKLLDVRLEVGDRVQPLASVELLLAAVEAGDAADRRLAERPPATGREHKERRDPGSRQGSARRVSDHWPRGSSAASSSRSSMSMYERARTSSLFSRRQRSHSSRARARRPDFK